MNKALSWLLVGIEKVGEAEESDLKLAYHEAGHAIVNKFIKSD